MSMPGGGGRGPSKNERRDAAREKARAQRELQRKKERRRRLFVQGGVGVVIIAVIAIIALVLVNSNKPAGPGPANMADDGIIIGKGLVAERTASLAANATPKQRPAKTGVVAIRTYEDFQCPYCLEFEQTNAAQIKALVEAGKATLQIYPVAILDASSQGTKYSTRSANAAACVANYSPDQFYAFHQLLYAHQPKEQTTGLTDAQLTGYAKDAKVGSLSAITKCIANQTYSGWVGAETERFLAGNLADSNATTVQGTPTVIVNGKVYSGSLTDASAFASFVLSSDSYTPTPTPSATPTPTPSPSPTKTN